MRLLPTTVGVPFEAGPFVIEPLRVTHSIADATALALTTAAGLVVHTGDFKLDPNPIDGELTDEARFRALGDQGVRLLFSDSTNVDSPGHTNSEGEVAAALEELILAAPHRVVLGMFASNVQRLIAVGRIAARAGRKVCLLGRSVLNHTRAARDVGRLPWASDLIVPPEMASSIPRERLLVIASGTQAERNAALRRLALGTHQNLRLDPDDTVILSSRVIPGNDRAVSDLVGDLLRLGVRLIHRPVDRRIHASGHAQRDEQHTMIAWTRPEAFVPVHGTLHHLKAHAQLAQDAGVPDVLVIENGELTELNNQGLRRVGEVPVGRVAAYRGEDLSETVVKQRIELARVGTAVVALVLDADGEIVGVPKIVTRGVLGEDAGDTVHDASRAVLRALRDLDARARRNDATVVEVAGRAARRAIEQQTRSRPLVDVAITRLEHRRRP